MQGVIVLCCIYVVLTNLKIINEVGIVQDFFLLLLFILITQMQSEMSVYSFLLLFVCFTHENLTNYQQMVLD